MCDVDVWYPRPDGSGGECSSLARVEQAIEGMSLDKLSESVGVRIVHDGVAPGFCGRHVRIYGSHTLRQRNSLTTAMAASGTTRPIAVANTIRGNGALGHT